MAERQDHILVIDDDEMVTGVLRKALTGEGYRVTTAGSGEEALEKLSGERFDLLITDLVMPGIDGLELIERAREQQPSIPTIVITGRGDKESAVYALRLGASDYLDKPFESGQVVEVVARVLEESKFRHWRDHLLKEFERQNHDLQAINRALDGQLRLATEDLGQAREELGREKERVLRATRLRGRFLADTSFKLRTVMNSIIGFSEELLKEADLPEEHTKGIEKISRNSNYLLAVFIAILDLVQLESGMTVSYGEEVSLRELVDGVLDKMKHLGTGHEVEMRNEIPAGFPQVFVDREHLEQVLVHLVGNAIKFTPRGQVTIKAEHDQNSFVIEVGDTGRGIRGDEFTFICDEFRQGTREPHERVGGTGLGLAIVKRLCQLMGGEVSLKSKLGAGSAFRVTLPLKKGRGDTETRGRGENGVGGVP